MTAVDPHPPLRRPWRSAGAVFGGLLAVFVLSLGTDEILHLLQLYPTWGQRMSDPLFALATAYRIVFNVAGGYIAARLAPSAPLRHAMALGIVGRGVLRRQAGARSDVVPGRASGRGCALRLARRNNRDPEELVTPTVASRRVSTSASVNDDIAPTRRVLGKGGSL